MSENTETIITFLSCFKCGRIVRSTDTECPRCGMKFGPGTLFECPFCAGLVWRNAEQCTTCNTDLVAFAKRIEDGLESFSMDGFVDDIIGNELENIRRGARRVACPSCGLMIRGDEDSCPRCEMAFGDARVDCPVCGEKVPISEQSCWSCGTVFSELAPGGAEEAAKEIVEIIRERYSEAPEERRGVEDLVHPVPVDTAAPKEAEVEETEKKREKPKKKKKSGKGFRKKK